LNDGKRLNSHSFDLSICNISHTASADEFFFETKRKTYKVWNYKTYVLDDKTQLLDIGKGNAVITTLDLQKIVYQRDDKSIGLKRIGYMDTCIGSKESKTRYELSGDGKILWTRDAYTIRMYGTDLYPFWTCSGHRTFKSRLGECIRLLFMANRILWERKKRKRLAFAQIPREIMCHIFSFLRRES
jgi:hypothetical protein